MSIEPRPCQFADAAGCLAASAAPYTTPRQPRGGDELDASRVRRSVFGGSRDEDADAGEDREAGVREAVEVIDYLAPGLQGNLTGKLV